MSKHQMATRGKSRKSKRCSEDMDNVSSTSSSVLPIPCKGKPAAFFSFTKKEEPPVKRQRIANLLIESNIYEYSNDSLIPNYDFKDSLAREISKLYTLKPTNSDLIEDDHSNEDQNSADDVTIYISDSDTDSSINAIHDEDIQRALEAIDDSQDDTHEDTD